MGGHCRGIMMEMVRVKAEPLYTDANASAIVIGVNEESTLDELYLDHEIKEEIVIGPEVLQPADTIFTETPAFSINSHKYVHQDHTYVKTARTDIDAELAKQKRRQKLEERHYNKNMAKKNGSAKKGKMNYEVKTAKLVNQAKVEYHEKMAKLDHRAKMKYDTKSVMLDGLPNVDYAPAEDSDEVQFVCELPAPVPAEPAFDDSCVLVHAPAPALTHVVKVEPVDDVSEPADVLFSQHDAPEQESNSEHSLTPSHIGEQPHCEDMNTILPLDISEKQMNHKTNKTKGKINKKLLREIYLLHGLTHDNGQTRLKSVLKSNNQTTEKVTTDIYKPLNTIVCQSENDVKKSYQELLNGTKLQQTDNELKTQRTNDYLRSTDECTKTNDYLGSTDEYTKTNYYLGSTDECTKTNYYLGSTDECTKTNDDLGSTDECTKTNDDLGSTDECTKTNDDLGSTDECTKTNDDLCSTDDCTKSRLKNHHEFPGLLKVTHIINETLPDFPETTDADNFKSSSRSYPEYAFKSPVIRRSSDDHSVKGKRNGYYESPVNGNYYSQVSEIPTDYEITLKTGQRKNLNNSRRHENTSRRKLSKSSLKGYTENDIDNKKSKRNLGNDTNRDKNDKDVATESKTEKDIDLNLSSYKTDKVIYHSDYESFFLKSVEHNIDFYGDTEESEYTSQNNEMDNIGYENFDENGDSEVVASYTEIGECVCALCHETFADKAELLEHVVVHIHMNANDKQEAGVNGNASDDTPSTNKQRNAKRKKIKLGRASFITPKPKYHPCDQCDKTFSKPSRLLRHKKNQTNHRTFSCRLCEKTFTDASSLRTHFIIHTGQKQYSCKYCHKQFNQHSHLKTHERVHTGEKPFSCSVCQMTFSHTTNLKRHELIHTGERPYECSYCQKAFRAPNPRNRHERIHTGEKPYCCKVCGRSFSQLGGLRNHRFVHTGERPYQCDLCSKALSRKHDLIRHIKSHHNNVSVMFRQRNFGDVDVIKPAMSLLTFPLNQ